MGFHELFFDLFFVAALAVYTKEAKLATGADVASYILYFTLLWSTWAANAVYDVRFGSKDVVNDGESPYPHRKSRSYALPPQPLSFSTFSHSVY